MKSFDRVAPKVLDDVELGEQIVGCEELVELVRGLTSILICATTNRIQIDVSPGTSHEE